MHDVIVKERDCKIAKFCGGQGGTETYVNDVNGINDKLFCRTILKIAVVGKRTFS